MIRSFLLNSVLMLTTSLASALPASVEQELQEYIIIFESGSDAEQVKAAQVPEWAGLSDSRLFDIIAADVERNYRRVSSVPAINVMAWKIKALAYSGQRKYRPTIENAAYKSPKQKLKKHAQASLPLIEKYTLWNPIIINESTWRDDKSAKFNRYYAMISSNDPELMSLAARRTYFEKLRDEELLDQFEIALLNNYKSVDNNSEKSDALNWVCKVLAKTGNKKYIESITEVANGSSSSHLKWKAKKYLRSFPK